MSARGRNSGLRGPYGRAAACEVSDSAGEEGFAAVDALVALTLLAMTLALTIVAAQTAQKLAARALETRRADTLLRYVLSSGPHVMGSESGEVAGFHWTLTTAPSLIAAGASAPPLCTRIVSARAGGAGRLYQMATSEVCPPERPAAP
ncbi:MAG: hypothetical protein P4L73_05245 [Caulobacteraceae bacterium]|nr:hypothetical protein [Caulobacteraceae bacterium]